MTQQVGPNPFKRKFRWTFEATINEFVITPFCVKVPNRPRLTFGEMEEQGEDEVVYKIVENSQKWLPVTMIVFDTSTQDLASLLKFTSHLFSSDPAFVIPKGKMTFKLWDGAGNLLEEWVLENAHFIKIDFSSDDYSSDSCDLEFTIEYDSVEYKNHFSPNKIIPIESNGIHFMRDGISPEIIPDVIKIEVDNKPIIITDGIVASEYTTGYINITGDIPKEIKINTDNLPKEIHLRHEGIPEKITIKNIPDKIIFGPMPDLPNINIPDITVPPYDPDMKFPPLIFAQPFFTEEELAKLKCKPTVPFPSDKHV